MFDVATFLSLLSLLFQLPISFHHHPVQHHLSWYSNSTLGLLLLHLYINYIWKSLQLRDVGLEAPLSSYLEGALYKLIYIDIDLFVIYAYLIVVTICCYVALVI